MGRYTSLASRVYRIGQLSSINSYQLCRQRPYWARLLDAWEIRFFKPQLVSDRAKRPHLPGWRLLTPARPGTHREQAGDRTVRSIGAWLVSTLIWLPLFVPLLAMDVRVMPVSSEQLSSSAFVVAGWVLTGLSARGGVSRTFRLPCHVGVAMLTGGVAGVRLAHDRLIEG